MEIGVPTLHDFETSATVCGKQNLENFGKNNKEYKKMASSDLDDVTKKLRETTVDSENELSFKGKGLKLDKKEDGRLFTGLLSVSNFHSHFYPFSLPSVFPIFNNLYSWPVLQNVLRS